MGKQSAPQQKYEDPTSNLKAAASEQMQANRPTQSTPWATQNWAQDGNGQWSQSTNFNGPMGEAANNLQQQYAQSVASPFSFDQFGKMTDGSAARDQAITAAYGQASSRLDPMWSQREDQARTRLLNQGLDPSSEAYRNEMGTLGQQRNDAYTSAMNMAIGQGQSAGDSVFNNNMASRQQSIAEALRQRGMPMQELQQMQGFLSMPGFNQDSTTYNAAADAAGANERATMAGNSFNERAQGRQDAMSADVFNNWMKMWGSVAGAAGGMSDERTKMNIERSTEFEVLPGVPFASWEWKHNPGERHFGVIAQDLEKVAPQHVTERDGVKFVDYSFLKGR